MLLGACLCLGLATQTAHGDYVPLKFNKAFYASLYTTATQESRIMSADMDFSWYSNAKPYINTSTPAGMRKLAKTDRMIAKSAARRDRLVEKAIAKRDARRASYAKKQPKQR